MNDRAAEDASSQAPATASRSAQSQRKEPEGSIKETVESIIVAFILAFIFRGFIVEAFVIPTGSMAPTLLGAHMRFNCQDCGYQFDVNYPGEGGDGDDIHIPSFAVQQQLDAIGRRVTVNRVLVAYCPNCGYKIPRSDPSDRHNDATAPPVRYGDRILVLKYLYLFNQPDRWDVVVFKNPSDPSKYDQNYIKRLVGKPGEAIFILDGDVYVGKPDAQPEQFLVQTKPRHVQEALWRIVSASDYLPRGLPRDGGKQWIHPWRTRSGETGWDTSGRAFRFSNPSGAATLEFDADANPDKHALTDWLAYDVLPVHGKYADAYHTPSYPPHNNVSDVKLEFYYQRTSGDGPLRLVLTKLDHDFVATLESDRASLHMRQRSTGKTTEIARDVPIRPAGNRPRHVEFMNVDYRVTLRLDGRDVIQTTPQQYQPDMPFLLDAAQRLDPLPKAQIQIEAERQECVLSHVRLWRDTYYGNRNESRNPVRWGSPPGFELKQDEYFVLGDNSPISGDARVWSTPIDLPDEKLQVEAGRVPARFLIGKAFFVYWPAGYRPIDSAPALAPNFGDMRFIH